MLGPEFIMMTCNINYCCKIFGQLKMRFAIVNLFVGLWDRGDWPLAQINVEFEPLNWYVILCLFLCFEGSVWYSLIYPACEASVKVAWQAPLKALTLLYLPFLPLVINLSVLLILLFLFLSLFRSHAPLEPSHSTWNSPHRPPGPSRTSTGGS